MSQLSIQDVARRSGLTEPTLRYYEQVGLLGPIDRDPSSGYRRYAEADLDSAQVLACLRTMGVGIAEMRTYQSNRAEGGPDAAAAQRDLLQRHARRVDEQIAALRIHQDYLREKSALWDARARGDAAAEAAAMERVLEVTPRLQAVAR